MIEGMGYRRLIPSEDLNVYVSRLVIRSSFCNDIQCLDYKKCLGLKERF